MIDAMCSECRHFSCAIFSAKPGWKCAKDPEEKDEHDPTDQACAGFERQHGAVMLVRQEIPVPVRLTGQIDGDKGCEVVPEARNWEGRTAWLRPGQLMWEDELPVSVEELGAICRFERDVAAVMTALVAAGERMRLGLVRVVSEGVVDAVRDMNLSITPADLIKPMKNAGKIRDLVSGVSAHKTLSDLAKSGALAKWGVTGFAEPKEKP
jgi:hypothetical protein